MARCQVCDKRPSTGHRISITRSQVSRRAKRVWKPNVKKFQIVTDNGTIKSVKVCMRCVRSKAVTRAI